MKMVLTLYSWQLSIMLAHVKTYPNLKLPTKDEIKDMLKEAHQRFKRAIRNGKRNSKSESRG